MATLKLKFRPSSVAGEAGTLYFQLTHRRTVRCLHTDYRVFPGEWSEKLSAVRVCGTAERRERLRLIRSMAEWEQKRMAAVMVRMERAEADCTADDLWCALERLPAALTFFGFVRSEAERKRQMGREGTARTYVNALRSFSRFRQGEDIAAEALEADMMERYEAWLVARGLKRNSSSCYLRTLRTLYRRAVEAGLTENRNVFRHVFTGVAGTAKRALPLRYVKAIRRLDLSADASLLLARDVFLFSFYMRGMPFVDMAYLRKSDLRDGMVRYSRRKTRQTLEVVWENAMQDIVDGYAHLTAGSPYLLPIITRSDGTERRQYERMERKVTRGLRKIARMVNLPMPLTTYVARHTWASLARDAGFPLSVISRGMGHESLRTTQIYLSSIDNAAVARANRLMIEQIQE